MLSVYTECRKYANFSKYSYAECRYAECFCAKESPTTFAISCVLAAKGSNVIQP